VDNHPAKKALAKRLICADGGEKVVDMTLLASEKLGQRLRVAHIPTATTAARCLGLTPIPASPRGRSSALLRAFRDRAQMQVDDNLINLTPGMAVTAEIKTGSCSVLGYLLSP
jgi:hypothetical protein